MYDIDAIEGVDIAIVLTGGTGDAGFVLKLGKVGCVSHMY